MRLFKTTRRDVSRRGAQRFSRSGAELKEAGNFSRRDAKGAEKGMQRKSNHIEHIGEIAKSICVNLRDLREILGDLREKL
jgi:hypothetical protein